MSNSPIKDLANEVINQLNSELCQLSSQEEREVKAKQIIKESLMEQEPAQANRLYQNISLSIHPDKTANREKPCVKAFNNVGKLQEILINVKNELLEAQEALNDTRTMSEKVSGYLASPNNFLALLMQAKHLNADSYFESVNPELETQFPILYKHHQYPEYIDQAASVLSITISVLAFSLFAVANIAAFPPNLSLSLLMKLNQTLLLKFSAFEKAALPYQQRTYMAVRTPLSPGQQAWTDEQLDNLLDETFILSTTQKQLFLSMKGHATTDEFSDENEQTFQRFYIPEYQINAQTLGIPVNTPYRTDMTNEAVADLYKEIRIEQNKSLQSAALLTTIPLFLSVINTYKNLFIQNEEVPSTAIKQALFVCRQLVKAILLTPLALLSLSVTFARDVMEALTSLTTQAIIGLKFVSALLISAPLYFKDVITPSVSEQFSHKNIPLSHQLTLFPHAEMPAEIKDNDDRLLTSEVQHLASSSR